MTTYVDIPDLTAVSSPSAITPTSVMEISIGGSSFKVTIAQLEAALAVLTNPMTTLGDVIVGGASGVPERQAVGADGTVLMADSTQTYGIKWGTAARTIASGTASLGTSAIASGGKASTVTVSAPGVLSTDTIVASFNSDPTGVTGYVPSTNGMLTIIPYPSSGNVNFIVANNTGSSITPGAITLNWRVLR